MFYLTTTDNLSISSIRTKKLKMYRYLGNKRNNLDSVYLAIFKKTYPSILKHM